MPQVLPSAVVRIIDKEFPWAKESIKAPRLDIDYIGRVTALLALIDRLPAHLLTLNETDYTDYIAEVETLRSRPAFWIAHPSTTRSGQPVRDIRNLLLKCSDDSPSESVHGLAFIPDEALRDDLRRDIDNAERALDASEWKAATVLAGSVIEALLLWKLSTLLPDEVLAVAKEHNSKINSDIRRWHLPDYILVASKYPKPKPLLSQETSKLLELVKDFRNLIHPGRAERLAKKCDRSTALTAIAGVVAVVAELDKLSTI